MSNLLFILEIISFTALILSAIFLAVAYIPHEKKVINLKKSKYLIQLGCILLGVGGLVLVTHPYHLEDITFFIQITAQIESLLLILAMILLLTREFKVKRFVGTQSCIIALSSAVLYLYYYVFLGSIETLTYYLLCGIYILLFLYYFFTYKKLFVQWRNKRSLYGKHGNTIKRLWLVLNILAMMCIVTLLFPSKAMFVALTVLYIIGIISFIILFYKLIILLNTNDFEQEKSVEQQAKEKANTQKNLANALETWIRDKGFVEQNITIIVLSKQLGTNRTYLSNFINEHYGENFNTWVNQLRIEEAKQFLKKEEMPLHEIAARVGFADLAHFSKTFKSITGEPPSTWRKNVFKVVEEVEEVAES